MALKATGYKVDWIYLAQNRDRCCFEQGNELSAFIKYKEGFCYLVICIGSRFFGPRCELETFRIRENSKRYAPTFLPVFSAVASKPANAALCSNLVVYVFSPGHLISHDMKLLI